MESTREGELVRAFVKFDKEHPQVWVFFVRFTKNRINAGMKHYSADAIMHRVRWETDAGNTGQHQFKINNNHVAFYARKFMAMYPQSAGFFRTRVRK